MGSVLRAYRLKKSCEILGCRAPLYADLDIFSS